MPKIVHDAKGDKYLVINDKVLGPITKCLYDPKKRIEDMNKENINLQVLSITPSAFFYNLESKVASALARAQNEALCEIAEMYKGRFIALATVPLQNVNMAIEELEYSIKDLGLKGVEIGSNINGENLDTLNLWPFYEKVEELGVPILVHPINPAGAERMQKYYLINLIGFPAETSLAIASVIFGGVLERFPKLKFCFVHGGGFVPYQIGRLEHGYKIRPEPKVNVSKPPSEYLRSIYFDTVLHYEPALNYLVTTFGADNILLGSDYPYDMGEFHPVLAVQKLRSISFDDKTKILGTNALKIFKI